MNRPDRSEDVAGVDDAPPPVVKPQHDFQHRPATFALAYTQEMDKLRQALDECRRTALRARARCDTEPNSIPAALEHIALTAGATLHDLKGPREGRWA